MTDLEKVKDWFERNKKPYDVRSAFEDEKKESVGWILQPDAPLKDGEVKGISTTYYAFDEKGKFIGTYIGTKLFRQKSLAEAFEGL